MAEVYLVSNNHAFQLPCSIKSRCVHRMTSLTPLVKKLFQKGNSEKDANYPTVVVFDHAEYGTADSALRASGATALDSLPYADQVLILRYYFSHLNMIVTDSRTLSHGAAAGELNAAIDKIELLVSDRISRVATWTGTGININDFYSPDYQTLTRGDSELQLKITDVIATMSCALDHSSNLSRATESHIMHLSKIITNSINFEQLLADHSELNLRRLCHCVGHWAFPAHELTNDDLVYCVYLILGFALAYIKLEGVPDGLVIPTPNELMAIVYMTRDTYKNGNPFHNFRHAVDVLQACFHYLVKLRCLPEFEQLEEDPRADETELFTGKKPLLPCIELVAKDEVLPVEDEPLYVPHLNPLQSLGLLVAALGHDVGHPGVTNAFMIKHSAPTSQLFGERSVLELYHSTIFTNKVLSTTWPSLLSCETATDSSLSLKKLIIGSILATDMAEHFEYIHKLKEFQLHATDPVVDRVKLISSLLIKCADISNVTRPTRVSSQWALVLSREFAEVEILEKKISSSMPATEDVVYERLPTTLDEVLECNPTIHKGQIFFIQTFAEGLFSSILDLFPELQFTCDIIQENKSFWESRP